MSKVTNAVLCIGLDDSDFGKVNEVNTFFDEVCGFVGCDDPALPRGWYGGSKYLEAAIYVGAFNYLDLDAFLRHLRSISWAEPQCVQLLLNEQDDDRFRLVNVIEVAE